MQRFDALYPQKNGTSALLQLQVQLGQPLPFDLDQTNLAEYKNLDPKWHAWSRVLAVCHDLSVSFFDQLGLDDLRNQSQ